MYHVRTKNINVSFHFVKEILDEGGYMFTKLISGVKFAYYKELLHILPVA